jgi:methionyl-tRNA synthetase
MTIKIDDFAKVEIKVGKILSAEKVPETSKLLKLKVDFGMKLECIPKDSESKSELNECVDVRQVVSGISVQFPEPEKLIGMMCAFVTNLEPRKIKGLDSEAMILALGGGEEALSLLAPTSPVLPGASAR